LALRSNLEPISPTLYAQLLRQCYFGKKVQKETESKEN
jgi:hypothetical protein